MQEIEFFIGGFMGPSFEVKWDGSNMTVTSSERHYSNPIESVVEPSNWPRFWKSVDAAKVWEWDDHYEDPHVCDGTHWSLKLRRDGQEVECHGSNDYPESFDKLVRAIQSLTGRKDIR